MPPPSYKLLFLGEAGSGKTTAITSISDQPPISMEVPSTERELIGKTHTTVGFDYGEIALGDGGKLRLYGAPGQRRFSFMWEILAHGTMGIIMMVDNSRPDAMSNAQHTVSIYQSLFDAQQCAAVLAVTKSDLRHKPRIEDYRQMLADRQLQMPAFMIDARVKGDVLIVIDGLLSQIETCAMLESI